MKTCSRQNAHSIPFEKSNYDDIIEDSKLSDEKFTPLKYSEKNMRLYAAAYDHSVRHRTSNWLDRLMQRMDWHIF